MASRPRSNGTIRFLTAVLLVSGIFSNILDVSANALMSILSTLPTTNALNVARGSDIKVQADAAYNTSTVNSSTFTVRGNLKGTYSGAFTFPNTDLLRFAPNQFFKPGEKISVTATAGIENNTADPLKLRTWQFTAAAGAAAALLYSHPTTPSFGAQESYGVALGDLDGDGDLDAVVANYDGQAETVWLNNGSGSFSAHPTTPSFGAGNSFDLALGDLDGDGDLDALIANFGSEAETVWLNNGSGSFSAHPTAPSFGAGNSWAIDLGDLDSDGDLDALVGNDSGQGNTVWLNNGSGVFTAHIIPGFGLSSHELSLGDLDNDGDLDAITVYSEIQGAHVWLNNDSGIFSAPASPDFGTTQTQSVALGDLDGDGDLDAVLARISGSGETVWLNNGSGTFTAHPTVPSFGGQDSFDLALGDLDGDGDLDAVIANRVGESESVWLNNGSGAFSPHPAVPSFGAGYSVSLALGDLDGDNDLDVVIGNAGVEPAETVWLNTDLDLLFLPIVVR